MSMHSNYSKTSIIYDNAFSSVTKSLYQSGCSYFGHGCGTGKKFVKLQYYMNWFHEIFLKSIQCVGISRKILYYYLGVLIIILLIKILLTYKKNFQVKINGQNEEMLRAAIEQFGDKTDDEIAFGNIFSV